MTEDQKRYARTSYISIVQCFESEEIGLYETVEMLMNVLEDLNDPSASYS